MKKQVLDLLINTLEDRFAPAVLCTALSALVSGSDCQLNVNNNHCSPQHPEPPPSRPWYSSCSELLPEPVRIYTPYIMEDGHVIANFNACQTWIVPESDIKTLTVFSTYGDINLSNYANVGNLDIVGNVSSLTIENSNGSIGSINAVISNNSVLYVIS